ncbi:MAG: hypothetical protein HN348_15765 [Proteobacteria bacterium]|nr:hypothetical protein [Pseudomonadota bacterium]
MANNDQYGIWVQGGQLSLTDCAVNTTAMIGIDDGVGVWIEDADGLVSWSGNDVDNNDGYPLQIHPGAVPILEEDSASTYGGSGDYNYILVASDTSPAVVETSGSWPDAGIPYFVETPIQIDGDYQPTIDWTGLSIFFDDDVYVEVGTSTGGDLVVDTCDLAAQNEAAYWGGLVFHSGTSASSVANSTIGYSGLNLGQSIYIFESASVDVEGNTFSNSLGDGVSCDSSNFTGTIDSNSFDNIAGDDVTAQCGLF